MLETRFIDSRPFTCCSSAAAAAEAGNAYSALVTIGHDDLPLQTIPMSQWGGLNLQEAKMPSSVVMKGLIEQINQKDKVTQVRAKVEPAALDQRAAQPASGISEKDVQSVFMAILEETIGRIGLSSIDAKDTHLSSLLNKKPDISIVGASHLPHIWSCLGFGELKTDISTEERLRKAVCQLLRVLVCKLQYCPQDNTASGFVGSLEHIAFVKINLTPTSIRVFVSHRLDFKVEYKNKGFEYLCRYLMDLSSQASKIEIKFLGSSADLIRSTVTALSYRVLHGRIIETFLGDRVPKISPNDKPEIITSNFAIAHQITSSDRHMHDKLIGARYIKNMHKKLSKAKVMLKLKRLVTEAYPDGTIKGYYSAVVLWGKPFRYILKSHDCYTECAFARHIAGILLLVLKAKGAGWNISMMQLDEIYIKNDPMHPELRLVHCYQAVPCDKNDSWDSEDLESLFRLAAHISILTNIESARYTPHRHPWDQLSIIESNQHRDCNRNHIAVLGVIESYISPGVDKTKRSLAGLVSKLKTRFTDL